MLWFIVLLLLAGAGFFFYQKLTTIEREIRAEQDAEAARAGDISDTSSEQKASGESTEAAQPATPKEEVVAEPEVSDSPIVTPEVEKLTAKVEPVPDAAMSLEDEVLAAVNNMPGVKQTDMYSSFADVDKKQLQQLFKDMADDGRLKREKKGSSYLLYPA